MEKMDINNDYGIYPESGYVTTEMRDENAAYEHAERPPERRDPEDYENWQDDYDQMYMKWKGLTTKRNVVVSPFLIGVYNKILGRS